LQAILQIAEIFASFHPGREILSRRNAKESTMNQKHYFVACPGILGVQTNVNHFKWSYGTAMPPATLQQYDQCAVRLRLDVTDNVQIPKTSQLGKYHYWLGNAGHDTLYYDRPFCFGSRLQIAAKGLLSDEPCLTVNQTYYRYVSHRFMNLHSVGYILTDVASLLLLRQGLAPLHCSAFKHGDATVLVAAPPNTGKTLTSMLACLNHAAHYICEDLAVTDGRSVFSVPWTSTFRYYKQLKQSFASRIRNRATKVLPLFELWPSHQPAPITDYISSGRLSTRSRITHVVFLERGDTSLISADIEDACFKMKNLNRYEFQYCKSPLIVAYEYFNPQLSIDAASQVEFESIQLLLNQADQVWIARSNNPTQYAEMIIDAIGNRVARSVKASVAA
jgi:hypothetical protein